MEWRPNLHLQRRADWVAPEQTAPFIQTSAAWCSEAFPSPCWRRAHAQNMPVKGVPLQRADTCMPVTFGGRRTLIPQMFALISLWLRDSVVAVPSLKIRKKRTCKVKTSFPLSVTLWSHSHKVEFCVPSKSRWSPRLLSFSWERHSELISVGLGGSAFPVSWK